MPVNETEASRAGICYVTANGSKVTNMGEKKVKGLNDKGQNVGITIQMANIKKVLGSVSKMNDAGNTVIFSKGRSVVVPDPDSRLVSQVLQSVAEDDVTELRRENGTFKFDIWVKKKVNEKVMSPFHRQA